MSTHWSLKSAIHGILYSFFIYSPIICAEYGENNIQCNGIGPGYIETPQTAPLRVEGNPFNDFIISKTPAARWGNTDDLIGPTVFLASDASNFVNGHILYVDGGILASIGKQPEA